jgi:hypothetical protein
MDIGQPAWDNYEACQASIATVASLRKVLARIRSVNLEANQPQKGGGVEGWQCAAGNADAAMPDTLQQLSYRSLMQFAEALCGRHRSLQEPMLKCKGDMHLTR